MAKLLLRSPLTLVALVTIISLVLCTIRLTQASLFFRGETRKSTQAPQNQQQTNNQHVTKKTYNETETPSFGFSEDSDDYRVPFWNIAHMINSIDQIEPALRNGSNGIEVDVSFDSQGRPVESYHGFPCDCGRHCFEREKLEKFIRHLGAISVPPAASNLQLVVFDLKLKGMSAAQKETGGKHLAMLLDEHLYTPYLRAKKNPSRRTNQQPFQPPIRTVVSINHVEDNMLARAFLEHMRKNRLLFMHQQVGFDVGMNGDLANVTAMWSSFSEATNNIWQGDGLTNCANIIRGSDRLKEAIKIRNAQGKIRKVYYWTADIMYHIRAILRYGLDAVLTNQPQRVIQVLEEPEFKRKYRLATPYDDPFDQFWIKPLAWKMPLPTIGEAIETVTNIRETSANFVKTLPDGLSEAFKKVRNTVASIAN